MSEIFQNFSAIEILRLFLHGLFFVFPLVVFPNFSSQLNIINLTTLIVVSGLILYAAPIDFFFPIFKQKYKKEINLMINEVSKDLLKDIKYPVDPRSLYDIFYYDKLSRPLRYRIHYMVSLYYFYSRTFFASLFYIVLLPLIWLIKSVNVTSLFELKMILMNIFDSDIKIILITLIFAIITIFSYFKARNVLIETINLEKTIIACRSNEICEAIKK